MLNSENAALRSFTSQNTRDCSRKGSLSWPYRSPPSTISISIANLGFRQMPCSLTRLGSSSELIRYTSCLNFSKKLPPRPLSGHASSLLSRYLTATVLVSTACVNDGVDELADADCLDEQVGT